MIELIETFIRPLNDHDVPYIITGSVASMVYGEPRLTNDVDVVLDITTRDIPKLIQAFPEQDFYLPPTEIIETEILRGSRGHFNIISQHTMLKADIYLVGNDQLQKWGMQKANLLDIDGQQFSFACPEYVIIRKLQFFKEGNSQKHLRDIASIVKESSSELDHDCLSELLSQHHLQPEWQAALALVSS